MNEVYKSSTLGPIPLSFTGRHLLQSLREAIVEMADKAVHNATTSPGFYALYWERVSEARGKLAQYMSQLEKRKDRTIQTFAMHELLAEVKRRDDFQRRAMERQGWRVMMGKHVEPNYSVYETAYNGWA